MSAGGRRIVVGMSGGVDSAVAALLLKEQGYDVIGVFMNNWQEQDPDGVCCAEQDFADVRACCERLGIAYYSVNFARQYYERVFAHFLAEYERGRTPNPDVLCNREIKFKELLNLALQLQAEQLATGHYARIGRRDGLHTLLRGADAGKDQSYFLYMLGQDALGRALFPLGDLQKSQVRALAAQHDLPVAKKRDSTGICFIGERNFRQFLSGYFGAQPGDIITDTGAVLGRHRGLMYYTLGQRKGIGIGGVPGAEGAWFVVDKDLPQNRLIVAQGAGAQRLYRSQCQADALHFIAGEPPAAHFSCAAKIRYRQSDQRAHVAIEGGVAHIRFDVPQRAITPGQSIVFYDGAVCLGGGILV